MNKQESINRHRTAAILAGALILTATATYLIGGALIDPVLNAEDLLSQIELNSTKLTIGVLIHLIAAAANVGIGVVLFPVLKKYSDTVAVGYVATRIFDGGGVALAGIGTLLLVALSRGAVDPASMLAFGHLLVVGNSILFSVTMMALGLGSTLLCALLYRAHLIPRPLALLGIVGYVALLVGSGLELFGIDLLMLHYAPGGLFELIFPLWLIVRGFNSKTLTSDVVETEKTRTYRTLIRPGTTGNR